METMPRTPDRGTGATLVELVAVLLVLGALAVAAVPLFTGGSGAALDAATRRMAGDLRYAQEYATTHHVETVVAIDSAQGFYRLLRDGDPADPVPDPWSGAALEVDLPALFPGVAITAVTVPGSEVRFTPLGLAATGGSIGLDHPDIGSRTLIVTPDTGTVRVQGSP